MKSLRISFVITLVCLLHAYATSHSIAGDNVQSSTIQQVLKGRSHQLTYLGKEKIPNLIIDGQPSRIHTQGIYVTSNSLYVTGRLERSPKRALFLRFNRQDLSQFEYLDVTPSSNSEQNIAPGQDHPGGFDYDGRSFWIPVAISKPHSPTTIISIESPLDTPLTKADVTTAFVVDDHIGALAFNRHKKLLYGANWDTKAAYVWTPGGVLRNHIFRGELIPDQPNWALAVQDWKCLAGGTLLAGGYNKDPQRDISLSRAVLDLIDIEQQKLLDRIHIIDPEGNDTSLTHEGMTFFNNEIFLLPGDLGDNACLYRYRLEVTGD